MAEIHVGVKFNVVHLPEERIDDPRGGELIRIGKMLAAKGFCPGNCGNLSFRISKGFVITTVGASLGNLTAEDFALVKDVDLVGEKVFCAGKTKPSSESMMHKMIYDARPDTQVILHAHTLSLKNAITTKKAYPYGTLEFAMSAVDILKNHDIVILKDHGFVSIGNTVEEAFQKIR
jgi:ribulose-5-phosphate 4-epimerase/fuculose-1-phosphate aldolase